MKNRGKQFEKDLEEVFTFYEHRRLLVLRKVDPPTQFIGPGKIIYKANPFLDFVGSWTERGGRMLVIEAKHTDNPKLDISSGAGITTDQMHSLRRWHHAGAVAAVLWRFEPKPVEDKPMIEVLAGGVALLTLKFIEAETRRTKTSHVKWRDVPDRLKKPDFIRTLSAEY